MTYSGVAHVGGAVGHHATHQRATYRAEHVLLTHPDRNTQNDCKATLYMYRCAWWYMSIPVDFCLCFCFVKNNIPIPSDYSTAVRPLQLNDFVR